MSTRYLGASPMKSTGRRLVLDVAPCDYRQSFGSELNTSLCAPVYESTIETHQLSPGEGERQGGGGRGGGRNPRSDHARASEAEFGTSQRFAVWQFTAWVFTLSVVELLTAFHPPDLNVGCKVWPAVRKARDSSLIRTTMSNLEARQET